MWGFKRGDLIHIPSNVVLTQQDSELRILNAYYTTRQPVIGVFMDYSEASDVLVHYLGRTWYVPLSQIRMLEEAC